MKAEKVIRFGLISASVFANEMPTQDGTRIVRNVSLQRRYKDSEGEWKTSPSLSLADMPVAISVLQRALDYVASVECDRSDS